MIRRVQLFRFYGCLLLACSATAKVTGPFLCLAVRFPDPSRVTARDFENAASNPPTTYNSPSSRAHKKRRVISHGADTLEPSSRPGRLAAHWGVMPHHMDYTNKLPRIWITSKKGQRVLSPWALAWFDKQPRRLDNLPKEYRQVYEASFGEPRVKFLVDIKEVKAVPLFEVELQSQMEQRRDVARVTKSLQQVEQMDEKNAKSEGKSEGEHTSGQRQLHSGYNSQSDEVSRPTSPGLHPVGGWGELPENELDVPLPVHACHGGSAPLPPQRGEPENESSGISHWQTKSNTRKHERGGMPIWACLVDVKYRPKPWGEGERMPEDYYRARFRVGAEGHLPNNVIPNNETQKAAEPIMRPLT
ncbi:uncharacterized protein K460DRAFT_423187 [Cucurbitaria berberidis CBS 394.84]|uniref:Uncharacterized protein n=1 Tax=Cucurbitaria berberidis CBS 394.84 TaxID=1168544 RepID=A0A9P4GST7_9PLEO|nr:uncharacterized protein K460DRAFT_423187 [Cucurbitaria berberidis CBS 394.84]KAF1850677.1 hypothetical protein K460DRAFT_423187 [Cucurbitaria berberidis CBS 394.84]